MAQGSGGLEDCGRSTEPQDGTIPGRCFERAIEEYCDFGRQKRSIGVTRGAAAIFLELDQLFMGDMASQAMSLSGELLKMRRKPGEAMEDFCTRFRVAVDACNGIQIGMQPVMLSCLLLDGTQLSSGDRALVLATTNRSLDFNAILGTVRQLFGKDKY